MRERFFTVIDSLEDEMDYEPISAASQTIGMGYRYIFEAIAIPHDPVLEPYVAVVTFCWYIDDEWELEDIRKINKTLP